MVFYTRIKAYFLIALLCTFSIFSFVSAGDDSKPINSQNTTGDELDKSNIGHAPLNLDTWAFVTMVAGIYATLQPRVPPELRIFITVFTSATLVLSLLAYYLPTHTATTSNAAFWALVRKILEKYFHIFWFFVAPITILLKIMGRKTRPIRFSLVGAALVSGALAVDDTAMPMAVAKEIIRGGTGPNESASAVAILMWVLATMVFLWGGVLAIEEGRWHPDSQNVSDVSPFSFPISSGIIACLLLFWVILWLVLRGQHQNFLLRDQV